MHKNFAIPLIWHKNQIIKNIYLYIYFWMWTLKKGNYRFENEATASTVMMAEESKFDKRSKERVLWRQTVADSKEGERLSRMRRVAGSKECEGSPGSQMVANSKECEGSPGSRMVKNTYIGKYVKIFFSNWIGITVD